MRRLMFATILLASAAALGCGGGGYSDGYVVVDSDACGCYWEWDPVVGYYWYCPYCKYGSDERPTADPPPGHRAEQRADGWYAVPDRVF
jgi:hypothetical protein